MGRQIRTIVVTTPILLTESAVLSPILLRTMRGSRRGGTAGQFLTTLGSGQHTLSRREWNEKYLQKKLLTAELREGKALCLRSDFGTGGIPDPNQSSF